MSDPLYELLAPHLTNPKSKDDNITHDNTAATSKYLSRLLSLRLTDLTTTEPQSLTQATHSNHVSIQALSSRSHRTTTTSATHLSTLQSSLPSLLHQTTQVRESIPSLDDAATHFAGVYARSRDVGGSTTNSVNPNTNIDSPLSQRKDAILLARHADRLTDLLDLPSLLSTAIASAASGTVSAANYTQALDLFAHIMRLSVVYPDSEVVRGVQAQAREAMKAMTANLMAGLRAQNVRLAAAIRTVGWLRRVVPELGDEPRRPVVGAGLAANVSSMTVGSTSTETTQSEGSFGALFLVSRLQTFLSLTEALAPLRDLADQETEKRISMVSSATTQVASTTAATTISTSTPTPTPTPPTATRRPSTSTGPTSSHGTQTERYLKRYIEIFREHSFSTISMYRNIFPEATSETTSDLLTLPSALQQFPLHLVEIFMEVLKTYLPNVVDPAARESLLMQVLYAANSLGRLGADFSLMIALLDDDDGREEPSLAQADQGSKKEDSDEVKDETTPMEPEWARIIKKHRVQAARLDALAAGQSQSTQRGSDIAVR